MAESPDVKETGGGGLLRLAAGRLRLVMAPGAGGSILRLDHVEGGETLQVLRGIDHVPELIVDAACFPLVPFCNRIRDGRFIFRGREVRLAPNLPGDPSPLHGQGWLGAWDVESSDESTAMLTFRHRPGEWPWAYEARQEIALDPDGLSIRLVCRNADGQSMPCGLGQHPYFRCTGETLLDTHVEGAWTIDANVLPVERVPAAGRYDLHDRRICGQGLDNGFDGWSGRARIADPALPFEIEIGSPDAHCFQVYSPASGGFFVAEPVGHVNCALNAPEEQWEALGIRILAPGEEMALDFRLSLNRRSGRDH